MERERFGTPLCTGQAMHFEKSPAVYIMANRYRGTLYTGVTSSLGKRVHEHREGSFGGFSAQYGTKTLVWYENHEDMSSAITRETQIKAWRRQWKIELIESINRDWLELSDNLVHRPFVTEKAGFQITPSPFAAQMPVAFGMTEYGEGIRYFPHFLDEPAQQEILVTLRKCVTQAPLFQPIMPRTGRPFSVKMTNLGTLGWVSDRAGYRYQAMHPETGEPWPAIPEMVMNVWRKVANYAAEPEACLVNFYAGGTKMGLHQDKDEEDFAAPVVSISLGDTAVFRIGGTERGGKTSTIKLQSGDVLVMGGEARLCFHGVDRVLSGTSTLLKDGGRINLTLRRVRIP
jgi:DNA oxidative demethylase